MMKQDSVIGTEVNVVEDTFADEQNDELKKSQSQTKQSTIPRRFNPKK